MIFQVKPPFLRDFPAMWWHGRVTLMALSLRTAAIFLLMWCSPKSNASSPWGANALPKTRSGKWVYLVYLLDIAVLNHYINIYIYHIIYIYNILYMYNILYIQHIIYIYTTYDIYIYIHIIYILYPYGIHIIYILYPYYIHIISILYTYYIHVILYYFILYCII